ncbi:hypothetical protein AB0H71_20555 [Nocardia sp. NPDC050697]|uniref:hypothetical protein n=1 Tax=Nocardia sp. NPDC050697 TaxID=3155158 RepID=UPI0033F4C6BB
MEPLSVPPPASRHPAERRLPGSPAGISGDVLLLPAPESGASDSVLPGTSGPPADHRAAAVIMLVYGLTPDQAEYLLGLCAERSGELRDRFAGELCRAAEQSGDPSATVRARLDPLIG